MSTKPLLLSSSGLKNVNINANNQEENEFSFIFCERKIKMNTFVAEFLSPSVARLHLSDPTVDSIHFSTSIDEDIISLFENLSRGCTITITNSQSYKLKLLSLLLNNDELFDKINELYPETKLEEALKFLENIEKFNINESCTEISITSLINLVSANFESIEADRLKKLPKSILYEIITNEHLMIHDYDSFFDIIHEIFDVEEIEHINHLYEQVDISKLREKEFHHLILSLNPNEISTILWVKICDRIINKEMKETKKTKDHEETDEYLFDGKEENSFKGIINHLNEINGGNVHDKGIISISSSSTMYNYYAKFVADLNNKESNGRLVTENEKNSWIQYDFKDWKIQPTHYSIRSIQWGSNEIHPQSWVIEGSNTGSDDWNILDSQNSVSYLNGYSLSHTFKIQETTNRNEFYRFLRLRQTGPNKRNTDHLSISALEFFGKII